MAGWNARLKVEVKAEANGSDLITMKRLPEVLRRNIVLAAIPHADLFTPFTRVAKVAAARRQPRGDW